MKRTLTALALLIILACGSPVRAQAPEPLAVNAYIRGATLTITVFSNATTSTQIIVRVPVGWGLDAPLTPFTPRLNGAQWIGPVSTTPRVFQLHIRATTGKGVGTILVDIFDTRGQHAATHAYMNGIAVESSGPILPPHRRWFFPVFRH